MSMVVSFGAEIDGVEERDGGEQQEIGSGKEIPVDGERSKEATLGIFGGENG